MTATTKLNRDRIDALLREAGVTVTLDETHPGDDPMLTGMWLLAETGADAAGYEQPDLLEAETCRRVAHALLVLNFGAGAAAPPAYCLMCENGELVPGVRCPGCRLLVQAGFSGYGVQHPGHSDWLSDGYPTPADALWAARRTLELLPGRTLDDAVCVAAREWHEAHPDA